MTKMLEFPIPTHKLYKFKQNGTLYVADIDRGMVLNIDSVCWEILELGSSFTNEQILKRLSANYSEDEVLEAIENLSKAAKQGFFFQSEYEQAQIDSNAKKRPKIFMPEFAESYLADINYIPSGAYVAAYQVIRALAKYADIYLLSEKNEVISDGIYGLVLPERDSSVIKLHFLQHHYDGILMWSIRDLSQLFWFSCADLPIISRLFSPRGDGDELINAILMRYAVMRDFDAFIMPSASVKQFYAQYVLDTECFHVVPNGVDAQHFKPMDKNLAKKQVANILEKPEILEKPIVGFFSRFQPEKGAGIYLKIAQILGDVLFLVVAPNLHAYSLLCLPDNFIYAGRHLREVFPIFLNAFDVLCFPSIVGEESFGNALLEAMACGVPPVVPNFDGLPEVVGDAGVIVEAEFFDHEIGSFAGYVSPFKMAGAINQLLENEGERVKLSEKARQRALTLSWDATAQKILELFEQLNFRKQLQHQRKFWTRFVPYLNVPEGNLEWGSVLLNLTDREENPLMFAGYPQTLVEGIALSLLRRHTLHEVEAVLLHLCPTVEAASNVLRRTRGFLEATT